MKRHVITISFHMALSIDHQALTLVYGTMKLQIIPIKTAEFNLQMQQNSD